MKKDLEQLKQTVIGFSDEIPDEIAEIILKDVLACPACEAMAKRVTIDSVLEDDAPHWRRRSH